MHLHIRLPLEASCHAFSAFYGISNYDSLGSNPNITHALLRAATAPFVQPFTRNSYELNGIESEAFRSLNRLILLQKNVILVRTKLLLLISFHHILVNIETHIWHF